MNIVTIARKLRSHPRLLGIARFIDIYLTFTYLPKG